MRTFRVFVNGNEYEVAIEEIEDQVRATPSPAHTQVAASAPQPKPAPAAGKQPFPPPPQKSGGAFVIAQMPGTIVDILVHPGDQVTRGQNLLTLEAMKMSNDVVSPHNGTISEIRVTKGASVNAGDILVVLA